MTGVLDAAALERALKELVRRHKILRTTFSVVDDEVVQVVAGSLLVPTPLIDLSDYTDPEGEAQKLASAEAKRPFDLVKGPLIRTSLLRLDGSRHILLLTLHHIIFDGSSRAIFTRELAALYDAYRSGSAPLLPEPRLQYGQYAAWQRRNMQGKRYASLLAYWKKQLANVPAALALPADRPRPAVETFSGAAKLFALPKDLSDSAGVVAKRYRASLFMTLLAAFQGLLSKYSGQLDIVVGVPVAGRGREELAGVIGLLANELAMRVDLSGDPTFEEIIARVRNAALDAYDHQDMPFDKLVQELNPERSLSQNPLFQVVFSLGNYDREDLRLAGLDDVAISVTETHTAKFDLSMFLTQGPGGLSGRVEYNTDVFDQITIERMIGHFQVLLKAAVENPALRLSELPLLTAGEEHQLLIGWNEISQQPRQEPCLQQMFENQAAKTPQSTALIFEDRQLTYAELNRRSNQLAHFLRKRGVRPEVLVAIYVDPSLEMIVALLGVLKAGAGYLPLDPVYPRDRLEFVLNDAKVPILITQESLKGQLPNYSGVMICLDSQWSSVEPESGENPSAETIPDNVAYVIYTSGSTGRPKGVVVTHANATRLFTATESYFGFGPADTFTLFHSFAFDFSVWEIWGALLYGGRLVVVPRMTTRSPELFLELLVRNRVTVLSQTPSAFRSLVAADRQTATAGTLALRYVIFGGEVLEVRVLQQWFERHGAMPDLINGYGITETTVFVSFFKIAQDAVNEATATLIGKRIPDLTLYVLDPYLKPVPIGIPGELYVGGAGVAREYLNRPELNAQRFIRDPFHPDSEARLYKSGDLVRYLSDGGMQYLGRIDLQVKIRGFRIELGEIETVLAQHPAVKECIVIARDAGPENTQLVAFLVARDGTAPSAGELRKLLLTHLPDYMTPAAFVWLPFLPLSSNGKVDRAALPAPDQSNVAEREYIAPCSQTEEVLAAIWEDVLKLDRAGVADNFFEIGGHSLLATRVVSRIRIAFDVDLPLRDLFEDPTIAGLAARVEVLVRQNLGIEAPPLKPVSREGPLPLSFAQQRLWFLDQMDPDNAIYNVPSIVRLRGDLRVDALEWSLNEIARRHEALRTTFEVKDSEPGQVIAPATIFPLQVVDLTAFPESEREQEARRLAGEEAERPFHLAAGPLARALLVRLAEDDHVLVVNTHHIVSDGWSLGVLWQELTSLYRAFLESQPSPLQDLAVQYADYSVWQRGYLAQEQLGKQLAYWKRQLAGVAPLELPMDRTRPAVQTFRGDRQSVILPAALLEGLKSLGRREGVTLFMTLLGALSALLSRYSGQDDIVVGSIISGRNRHEIEGLIGFFVNSLVMRTRLGGNPTFRELLARVREAALGADANQDVPFEKLVEELQPVRDLSRNPLFQVLLAMHNMPGAERTLPNVTASPFPIRRVFSKFDLTLSVTERDAGLRAAIEYNTDLFDSATIDRMLGHLQVLLEAVVDNPDLHVSELPVLTPSEKRQILIEWNDTFADYPRDRTLHQFFERQTDLTPEAPALIFGNTQLSYRQLNSSANQLAHYLRSLGVGPETLVAVCAERSLEMVIALVAILKAGGAYVPIDPEYPAERLAVMLEDAAPKALLTLQRLLHVLPQHGVTTFCLDTDWSLLADRPTTDPVLLTSGSNAAYVIYTSGSTGKPKGVVNIHSGIVNRLLWMQSAYCLNASDRVLQKTPYSFDVSVWEFFWPLMTGACLVIALPEGHKDPSYLVDLIVERKITTMHFVPSMLRIFLETESVERCTSLRRVICSGEALSLDLEEQFFEKLPAELHNLYGPTEASVDVTYWQCAPHSGRSIVPIGRPIWNTQIYILDPNLKPLPVGVPGELHIGGAGLARGYLKRPELTAEKFIADPFSSQAGARLYKTGDLARLLVDGTVEYLGRIDFQVKIRGFRIELGEIEAALSQHPSVKECAVAAREDTPGDKQLVAYLVTRDGLELSTSELRKLLLTHLPDYMVPAAFLYLPFLPLSSNGKVDRRALPAPDLSSRSAGHAHVAPRTSAEEMLAGIWEDVLKLERIGVDDNFFELGGHSLLATRAVSRIRNAFRVEMPLRDLFEEPTVAGLARRIEALIRQNRGLQAPPLKRADRSKPLPLSFAQQRLWFLDQLEPGNPIYNIPKMARLRGAIQADAFERAVNEVVRRHEVLRTGFATVDGQPVQVVAPALKLTLPVMDFSDLSEDLRDAEVTRFATEEARRPFDLAKGPLIRTMLLRLAPDDQVFFINMHHIVTERWSQGLLWSELGTLYDAFIQGKPSPLPELAIQYADFAAWQREWMQGEVLEKQLSYWKTQLAGAPPVLELPTDRPRPATPRHRGSKAVRFLSHELVQRLSGFSRSEDVTLFMTLLAVFQTLLSRYSGQEDIVIGSVIAGRNYAEIEPLIGFFVNTIALRADLSGDPTFRSFLQRVKEFALNAYAHQDIPFEKLVEELSPERSLSYHPVFQVAFVQDQAVQSLDLSGLRFEGLQLHQGTSVFDITWYVVEMAEGVRLFVEYDTGLFDGATIERMLGHYEVMLQAVADSPDMRLSDLPLLTHAEECQFREWNDTQSDYPRDTCAHELFEAQATRTPGALAVAAAGRRLTYGELNQRANQLAHWLRAAGVGSETMVGVCLERSVDMIVAILGVLKAGGAYVPLDPAYPKDRLSFMLEDTEVPVLVTQTNLASSLPSHKALTIHLDGDWPVIARQSAENPSRQAQSKNLAYVIYTSGSTGKPKGVLIEHGGIANLVAWHRREYQVIPSDRATQIAALSFDASVWEIWPYLAAGASLHFPDDETRISPVRFLEWVKREGITLSFLPTPLAERLLDTLQTADSSGLNLRAVLTGGDQLHQRPGPDLSFRLVNHYGPTENSVVTTWTPVAAEGNGPPAIGRPIANTRIRILDQNRKLVPVGVPGELYVAGDGLARGYWKRPELTADRFVPDPYGTERLYRTGDRVRYLADGNVEFLGRLDRQVKVRGFRIELGEIEAVLGQHPGVKECVAVAREDAGESKRLVAYLVTRDGSALSTADLRKFLLTHVPDYMAPAAFVYLPSLPLSPNGKVDRQALPAPIQSYPDAGGIYAAPRTSTEDLLAAIWMAVLQLSKLGIEDNFFELGGHSLLATQAISRMREAFGVQLPLRALFESPTVAEMAAQIDRLQRSESGLAAPPVVPVPRDRPLPLSFAQQRVWFIAQLNPDSALYNTPLAIRLKGCLDIQALTRALNQLVERHEVLRTTYQIESDQPVQVIHPSTAVDCPMVDLSVLPAGDRMDEAERILRRENERPFQLAAGPMVRAFLVKLNAEEHVFLLVTHHIANDGWSSSVLMRDLTVFYSCAVGGGEPALPELAVQYADYAVWQRNWLQGEVLGKELAFWRSALAGAPPILQIPTDRPRPAVQTYRSGTHLFLVPANVMDAIRVLGRLHGTTTFMTMLAAFQALIYYYVKQPDIVLGTDLANRTSVRVEALIGFFVNLVVLRTSLAKDPSFHELLSRVRQVTLDAYAHQDMPFDKLVEELEPERSRSHNALVQALFVQQNAPRAAVAMPGLEISGVRIEAPSKFDMAVFVRETPAGITGAWQYNADLFDATTIERMTELYQVVLGCVTTNPDIKLSEVMNLLADWERQRRTIDNRDFEEVSRQKLQKIRRRASIT